MRTVATLLFAHSAAATTCLKLQQFNCGNIARYTDVTSSAQETTIEFFVSGSDSNSATFWQSASCGADSTTTTWSTDSACKSACETARACSTKVWADHCEQGCALDCQGTQAATEAWSVFQVADSYTGTYTVDATITNNGIGRSFSCNFADMSKPYCVAYSGSNGNAFSSDEEVAAWPDTSNTDQLGQPWFQVSLDTSCTSLFAGGPQGNLPDSPVTGGAESISRITGIVMQGASEPSCDGKCGAFSPGWGASCTHNTIVDTGNLGTTWHPASASDCYCSCTSDCKKNGDCCHDYDMCNSADLTLVGGVVQTQSPTNNANAGGATGDPFTEHAGKRTQFYLPLGRRVLLLKSHGIELLGEAKPSARKGDDQQWFKSFEIKMGHEQIALVEIEDAEKLLMKKGTIEANSAAAAAQAADELAALRDRLLRAKMELSKTEELRKTVSDDVDIDSASSTRKNMRSSQMPLSTLKVTVKGSRIQRESIINMANISLQITQDANRRIGSGFMESVWIEAPNLGIVLQSSVAQKFENEQDKIAHAHVNLKFTEINATAAEGPLPEIWGIRPMSRATSRLLVPLKMQQDI